MGASWPAPPRPASRLLAVKAAQQHQGRQQSSTRGWTRSAGRLAARGREHQAISAADHRSRALLGKQENNPEAESHLKPSGEGRLGLVLSRRRRTAPGSARHRLGNTASASVHHHLAAQVEPGRARAQGQPFAVAALGHQILHLIASDSRHGGLLNDRPASSSSVT